MRANFFRNVSNYKMLCDNTLNYDGIVAEYEILVAIELEEKKFALFCNNFMMGYDFLTPYIHDAVMLHGKWRCVLVSNRGQKILVVMNHYQYPRYVAML